MSWCSYWAVPGLRLNLDFFEPLEPRSRFDSPVVYVPIRTWFWTDQTAPYTYVRTVVCTPETEWLAEFLGDCDRVSAVELRGWCVERDGFEYFIPREIDRKTCVEERCW